MHYIRRMHYRAYRLGDDGCIVEAADVEADDDATAWQLARRNFAPPAAVELWSGKRYVGIRPLNP